MNQTLEHFHVKAQLFSHIYFTKIQSPHRQTDLASSSRKVNLIKNDETFPEVFFLMQVVYKSERAESDKYIQ